MSNVINLFGDEKDLEYCSYYVDDNDQIALTLLGDSPIRINRVGLTEFEITLRGESVIYAREKLAEFIHVASALIDSEERWRPQDELVGVNYDEG